MCSPSPPPPPNYTGAAEATAAGNLEAARSATQANRPDEYTPYGSRTWTNLGEDVFDQAGYDTAMAEFESATGGYQNSAIPGAGTPNSGIVASMQPGGAGHHEAMRDRPEMPDRSDFTSRINADQWRSDINFTPEGQRLFDLDNQTRQKMGELGLQGIGQMSDLFANRFQVEGSPGQYQGPSGKLPTYGENRQRVMDSMLARVDTDIDRDTERKRAQLVAQGIPVGSEAFNREMEQLDRQRTDARQQAEIQATDQAGREYTSSMLGRQQQGREGMADFTSGLDSRRQAIQEALLERQLPLNEANAFRSGSQIGMPTFQPYGSQQAVAGPDYMGAAQGQSQYNMAGHNADVAQRNAMMSGLFGLGAGGLAGGYF